MKLLRRVGFKTNILNDTVNNVHDVSVLFLVFILHNDFIYIINRYPTKVMRHNLRTNKRLISDSF